MSVVVGATCDWEGHDTVDSPFAGAVKLAKNSERPGRSFRQNIFFSGRDQEPCAHGQNGRSAANRYSHRDRKHIDFVRT